MKLYNYDIYIRSRGYSFDHPTNMKGCIGRTFKIYNKDRDSILYNKLSIIRRECCPTIIMDIGIDKVMIHTNYEELNLYQRRSIILDNTLLVKLGSIFIYKGKWK